MWPPGEFFFQGDRVVEAYNSICNPSKDQVNDARHKANLVRYKGGSLHHKDEEYRLFSINNYCI